MDITDIKSQNQNQLEFTFAAICLLYPTYALQQCQWLDPETLNHEAVRKYWSLLTTRLSIGVDDDTAAAIALQCAFEAGVEQEITIAGRNLPGQPMPQSYANEINRRAYITRASRNLGKLFKAVQDDNAEAIKAIADDLSAGVQQPSFGVLSTSDIHDQFKQAVMAGVASIPTGIPTLDKAIGGLEKKNLIIIAARPSMGKTAITLQLARNNCHTGGKSLVFSLEMSAVGLWQRMACPLAHLQWRDVISGRIDHQDRLRLIEASEKLQDQYADKLYIADGAHTTDTIWQTVASLSPDLVAIDHLRYIRDWHKGDNENKRQGRIAQTLHDLAKAFNLPVVLDVQLNRGVEGREDKRPVLSDLRDSGEIEEIADLVAMLYRDDYYQNSSLNNSETEVWIRKFRNGPVGGVVRLIFDKQAEWFSPKEQK